MGLEEIRHTTRPSGGAAPRVSVCIRAFARPGPLRAALDSALAQSFEDLEVVVSDDSGRLAHVVAEYEDPRVRYHANPHPAGPAANLKRAFGLARGDLLALLDDDDRWLPGFLATTVAAFDADPELGVVFTDMQWVAAGRRFNHKVACPPGRIDSMLPHVLHHSIPCSAALIRRETWEDGDRRVPVVAGMAGAVTLWLRAAATGWPFHHIEQPLAECSLHREQMSWSDDTVSQRYAATLERFRFDDEEAERLRRARLAEAHLVQAGHDLRRGNVRRAAQRLGQARLAGLKLIGLREALALSGVRRPAARFLARHPGILAAGLPIWRRVRPSVGSKPAG